MFDTEEENGFDSFNLNVNDVGSKLKNFYVALRLGELPNIILYLSLLENHLPLHWPSDFISESDSDDVGVVYEIVTSCREKTAQFYRLNFCNEFLSTLITNIRKKLMMKVSTSLESSTTSAANHQQRHLICLIDLLGSFSNLVMDFQTIHMSLPTQIMIVIPIHSTRIKETIQEIYKNFKKDKNLESIQEDILLLQQQKPLKSQTSMVNITVASLDNLLIQISSFLQTISRYYSFLNNVLLQPFHNFELYYHQYTNNDTTTTITPIKIKPVSVTSIYYPSDLKQQITNICEEMSSSASTHLRELDAFFISFEYKYLSLAITEAIQYTNLLHIERHVYIPQNIEDIFFLFRKVADRSISLQNDSILFATGHKIIEMIDPRLCLENEKIQNILNNNNNNNHDSNHNDNTTLTDEFLNVYMIISYKYGFHLCNKRGMIKLPHIKPNTNITPTTMINSSPPSRFGQTPPTSQNGRKNNNTNNNNSTTNSTTTNNNNFNTPAPLSGSGNVKKTFSTPSSALDIGAWFVEALTNELDNDDNDDDNNNIYPLSIAFQGNNSMHTSSFHGINDNTGSNSSNIQLKLIDMCVYISAVATCVTSIESLFHMYQATMPVLPTSVSNNNITNNNINATTPSTTTPNNNNNKPSPLSLVLNELNRCMDDYQQLFQYEITNMTNQYFLLYVQPHVVSFMDITFNMDGETMDRLIAEEKLSLYFKDQLFGPSSSLSNSTTNSTTTTNNSSTNNNNNNSTSIIGGDINHLQDIKSRLTNSSYKLLLELLAQLTVKLLFDCCLKASYSEWGAILIQHELRHIISYFDEVYASYLPVIASTSHMQTENVTTDTTNNHNNKSVFSMRQVFSPLQWFGTLITLDQPGNIRRYTVPLTWSASISNTNNNNTNTATTAATTTATTSDATTTNSIIIDREVQIAQSESLMKMMLSCRIDFSFEAIQKIKITFQ